jgi:aminoglycoside phosphotransferase (APT) family kinase protein
VIDVLAELATVEASPALLAMTVLDETEPFRRADQSWTDALSGLLARRVATYGDQLDQVVDKFETKFDCLQQLLREIEPANEHRLVHGDVTAGNILVDEQLRPVSVLDFGLLSMAGDPVFDGASAAHSTRSGHRTPAASRPTSTTPSLPAWDTQQTSYSSTAPSTPC